MIEFWLHTKVLLCMKNCSSYAEIKRKMAMAILMGFFLNVKQHFSSLKVNLHVTPSAALQQNWMTSYKNSDLQNARGLLPDQPQSSTLSSTALTLQAVKPVGHQLTSTSLWEATYKQDAVKTHLELGELQNSLLHPPFNNVSSREQAHPASSHNWSTGEQYV